MENSEIEIKEEICPEHNEPMQFLQFCKQKHYFCNMCEAKKEKDFNESMKGGRVRSKQRAINKALHNAMIAERFIDRSLDNFETENEGQRKAKRAALWFLDNMDDLAGMFFIGSPGTGKNHLAAGILKQAIIEHGKTGLITDAIKIVRRIKETWKNNNEKESDVIKAFTRPDILVIDELGVQFRSDTEAMYLTELINDRYAAKKQTILMGNLDLDEIKEIIGERATDRLREGGRVVLFDWESHRPKIGMA